MLTDERLYERYYLGDKAAAEMLVERYSESLIRYIMGYTADYQESEDLMIEAFAQMFSKRRPVDKEGCFKAYLYKVARNLSLRHLKKKRIPLFGKQDAEFELAGEMFADTGILQKEQNRQLWVAMEQIRPEYREVLYLIYFEDMKYEEAAAAMGKTVTQITNLVHRAKKSVKRILDREGFQYAHE